MLGVAEGDDIRRRFLGTLVGVFITAAAGFAQFSGGGPGNRNPAIQQPSNVRVPKLDIDVRGESNPLAKVAEQISRELGVPVAYEEPAWMAPAELMPFIDAPENRRNLSPDNLNRIGRGARVGGPGSIRVQPSARPGQEDSQLATEILSVSVQVNARRGNPGLFKVVPLSDYGYSIVPTHVRDEKGAWRSISSPLDVRISFSAEKRSLKATLTLIAKAVSDASGQKVAAPLELPSLNSFYDVATVSLGAQAEVARDVLAKALRNISIPSGDRPDKISWKLEYFVDRRPVDPPYVLRFFPILQPYPDGSSRPATWSKNKQ